MERRAGPDARGQVGEDGLGRLSLQLAERGGVPGRVLLCRPGVGGGGFGRPAEEGVGVEVAHHGLDDEVPGFGGGGWGVGAGAGAGAGMGVFLLEDGIGVGGERGERDVVIFQRLLRRGEEIPF